MEETVKISGIVFIGALDFLAPDQQRTVFADPRNATWWEWPASRTKVWAQEGGVSALLTRKPHGSATHESEVRVTLDATDEETLGVPAAPRQAAASNLPKATHQAEASGDLAPARDVVYGAADLNVAVDHTLNTLNAAFDTVPGDSSDTERFARAILFSHTAPRDGWFRHDTFVGAASTPALSRSTAGAMPAEMRKHPSRTDCRCRDGPH
ncbi:hypothetical protein [Microtetraspora glauca]|uniref:Uncharacterized protein n=1 Tax=Microtetraspora glauca TaxID=1996 RepID=A0ABV3G8V9_MICGL